MNHPVSSAESREARADRRAESQAAASGAGDAPPLPGWGDRWAETLGWRPDPAQQAQFQALYAAVLAGNRRANLTRIVEPEDFWEKHLWDSLRGVMSPIADPAALDPDRALRVLDIGTGAGFPGVPVAIARPRWRTTLLDSTRKKVAFLDDLVAQLGLTQVETRCDRAELLPRRPGAPPRYDLVLLRAVGPADRCADYALPLLAAGGTAVLYRGQWTAAEAASLEPVLKPWGASVAAIDGFVTPLTGGQRHCVYLRAA